MAEQPQHFAFAEIEAHVLDGVHAAKGLHDVAKLDKRRHVKPHPAVGHVDPDGGDQDQSQHHPLQRRRDAHQDHAALEALHDERADDRAVDGSDAAGERGAADHRRRDDVELGHRAGDARARVEAGGDDDRGEAAQKAHQHEDGDGQPPGVDAGELSALRASAHREDVAAKAMLARDRRHRDRDADQDQHRDRNAHRRYWICGCSIGVHDGGETDDAKAPDRDQQNVHRRRTA